MLNRWSLAPCCHGRPTFAFGDAPVAGLTMSAPDISRSGYLNKTDQRDQHGVEYFDTLSGEWDESERRTALARNVAKSLLDAIPHSGQERVMELGCGTGLVTAALAPFFASILAVDSSAGMLEVLAQKLERSGIDNVRVMKADFVHHMPEGPFDLIFSSMTLHHVDDVEGLFSRAFAQVAPGGYVAFADLENEDGTFHGPEVPTVRHHGFDPVELRRWLENRRFTSVDVRYAHTVTKQGTDGVMHEYPVLLVTARRAPDADSVRAQAAAEGT